MSTRYILDLATCPLEGAEDWLPAVKAKGNLKDPAKIADDLAEKRASQIETMGLDLDLCRISAIGLCDVSGWDPSQVTVTLAKTEADERDMLASWHKQLMDAETITFNGLGFDLPLLERRMLYLGLPPLRWNLDRYRTTHVDLLSKLSDHGKRPYRSLQFYAKRLGWSDLSKPLTGADEALAPSRGQWNELHDSVEHDVVATLRLAQWMRVLSPATVGV